MKICDCIIMELIQMFIIQIEKDIIYVSYLFILIQNKTRSSYESMFSRIMNICTDLDL